MECLYRQWVFGYFSEKKGTAVIPLLIRGTSPCPLTHSQSTTHSILVKTTNLSSTDELSPTQELIILVNEMLFLRVGETHPTLAANFYFH